MTDFTSVMNRDPGSQWIWERDITTVKPEDSMGWDMAFIDLLRYQIISGRLKDT